jgi:hypothetical protein
MGPEIYPQRCSCTSVSAIYPAFLPPPPAHPPLPCRPSLPSPASALRPPLPLVVLLLFFVLRLPLLLFLVLTVQQLLQLRKQLLLLFILSCLQEQTYHIRFTLVIASHRHPQSLPSLDSCHINIILTVITNIAIAPTSIPIGAITLASISPAQADDTGDLLFAGGLCTGSILAQLSPPVCTVLTSSI